MEKITVEHDYVFSDKTHAFFHFFKKFMNNLVIERHNKIEPINQDDCEIYSDDHEILICKNTAHQNIIAIKDINDKNRYFIGYYWGKYCQYDVAGMIVYFDNDNNLKQRNIIDKIILTFDSRNGFINTLRNKNTYLYHNSLCMLQCCRDGRCMIFHMCTFNDEDEITSSIFKYESKILSYCDEIKVVLNRFLSVKCLDHYLFFDLQSFKYICTDSALKKNSKFVYDYYKDTSIDEFTDKYVKNNNYNDEYDDYIYTPISGYPAKCIKCSGMTSSIRAYYNNFMCGLGDGFCEKCLIRYSVSDKCWVCCKFNGVGICYNKLNNKMPDTFDSLEDDMFQSECTKEHINVIYNFNVTKSLKFPNRNTGSISYVNVE
jgi:hypothetical protein